MKKILAALIILVPSIVQAANALNGPVENSIVRTNYSYMGMPYMMSFAINGMVYQADTFCLVELYGRPILNPPLQSDWAYYDSISSGSTFGQWLPLNLATTQLPYDDSHPWQWKITIWTFEGGVADTWNYITPAP